MGWLIGGVFALYLVAVMAEPDVWVKEMETNGIAFEGDIVLDPDEYEKGWNVSREHPGAGATTYASIKGGRWPGAVIPYVIDGSISGDYRARNSIGQAIADYHKYTCIRFKQRTNERTYVRFANGGGCSSPVGYRAGRVNTISLARGCRYKGTVMHEIGHTIGLYHEQSRPDRDRYVRINWNNINRNMQFNFNKQPSSNINSLGTRYDLQSMMHYGQTAFSINGRSLTIQTLDPANQKYIGQRNGFSSIDKEQINKMYPYGFPSCSTGNGGSGGGGGGGGGSSCGDKSGNCAAWARGGYCRHYKYKNWMTNNCARSCQIC